jgi:acyl-coenzyme A thioesterase PaaI-like protein
VTCCQFVQQHNMRIETHSCLNTLLQLLLRLLAAAVPSSLHHVTHSSHSSCCFLLPAGGGVVSVEGRLVKLGRDVASVEVTLRDDSSGSLVATGG